MGCISQQEELLMHRFFADQGCDTDGIYRLAEEDARHAVSVLRLKAGSHIEVICCGQRFLAEILSADRSNVRVRALSPLPSTEPGLSVTLFQGIPKGDKMDLIVQKATELGVSRIVPLIMNRCVVKTGSADIRHKLDRWRRISREAMKQSGRCLIPEITDPVTLHAVPGLVGLPGINVVPWENANQYGPLAFRKEHPSVSSLGIIIGPEGGIDQEEISFLMDSGFICITLGKRILRTETAGLASVAVFMSLYGEME